MRRVLPKLNECLQALVKEKIIEKIEKAMDWINAFIITHKLNGSLRIYLDTKNLNNIKREYCLISTLDEITVKLAGAKVFSTLDETSGFYQIVLDKESADLRIFETPYRYKFFKLQYGIKLTPEVFQERFRQIFQDCKGCEIYIYIYNIISGKNKTEHDKRLKKILKTAKKNKVKFNLSKCQLGKSTIKYMEHIISADGIALDESKVLAIKELQTPKSKENVQRALGMLTYVNLYQISRMKRQH